MAVRVSLRTERDLLRSGARLVAGVDEVGRGALCGPATVGIVVIGPATRSAPTGVRDSKLLTPDAREALVPRIRRWAVAWSVGHASAAEVDAVGIIGALRRAGHRALAALPQLPDVVLLDGNHDYLSPPAEASLLDDEPVDPMPSVRPLIKADLRCAAVAAASILAKTERDAIMVDLAARHPGYGWAVNKGYATPDHVDALGRLGPSVQHRRSWRLPGVVDLGRATG